MAKFPIDRSTGSVPGVSGNVVQGFSQDTGAGAVGQAVRTAGQTVFDVNSVLFRKQGEAELTESMSNANDAVSQMFLDFETNQDENTYQGKWDQTFAKIKQQEPKNGWARQQYRKSMFNLKDKIGGAVQGSITKRVDDRHDWAVSRMEALAIQSGDIEALRRGLSGFVKSGTMPQEEMDFRMTRAQPAADKRAKEINAAAFERELEQQLAIGGVDHFNEYIATPGIENDFGLTAKEAGSVISDFRLKASGEEKKQAAANAEALREFDNKVDEKIYQTHDLQWDDLEGHPDRVKRWKENLSELDRIKTGLVRDIPAEEKMAELFGVYNRNPTEKNRVAALDHWRANGSKLDKKYLTELVENEPESPLKDPTFLDSMDELDSTARAILTTLTDKKDAEQIAETRLVKQELLNDRAEFRRWMGSFPQGKRPTSQQIIEKFTELNKPRVQKQANSWFENLFKFSPGEFSTIVGASPGPGVAANTIEGFSGLIEPINFDNIIPNTNEQFEAAVRELNKRDPSKVQAFYDKWEDQF